MVAILGAILDSRRPHLFVLVLVSFKFSKYCYWVPRACLKTYIWIFEMYIGVT